MKMADPAGEQVVEDRVDAVGDFRAGKMPYRKIPARPQHPRYLPQQTRVGLPPRRAAAVLARGAGAGAARRRGAPQPRLVGIDRAIGERGPVVVELNPVADCTGYRVFRGHPADLLAPSPLPASGAGSAL